MEHDPAYSDEEGAGALQKLAPPRSVVAALYFARVDTKNFDDALPKSKPCAPSSPNLRKSIIASAKA